MRAVSQEVDGLMKVVANMFFEASNTGVEIPIRTYKFSGFSFNISNAVQIKVTKRD
jgi:hypothetical protein